MKFERYAFSEEIHRSLRTMGFAKPTDIQYKAILPIMEGEDVLAIAQTGTGKTAAFALPVVDMLHRRKSSKRSEGIKCVVMVPTRELAVQVSEVFQEIARYTRVNVFAVYGGVEQDPQIAKLQAGIDVLVATPGRLFDLTSQGYIKLRSTEILILDEADHMLDLGFIKDIRDLITYLPNTRQTLFFSATIDEKIKQLAYSLVRKAIRIQISPKDPVAKKVDHYVAHIEMEDKRFFLQRLADDNPESKILVFVRTKVRAERVAAAMERVSVKAQTLHGGKTQKSRQETLEAFKHGELKMLIATDVSARGIDIPAVEFVINYDLPDQAENYVHRVGRTGRGSHRGLAYSFCSSEEKDLLKQVEEYIHKEVKVLSVTKSEYEETLKVEEEKKGKWQNLLAEAEENEAKYKRKKKGKRK